MNRNKRMITPLQTAAVCTVSLLFMITALIGLYKCFSKPPEVSNDLLPSQTPGEDHLLQPQDPTVGGTSGSSDSSALRKKHFYTILVAGLDNENGGSDTNMLVALDAENGAINVMSLPRDTLLNVSWAVKKLNNAYHHGGISRTQQEVSNLLGIPVDFYITVDLQAFVELVDEIGGVDFNIPVDMDYDDPYQDLHIHFEKGPRHLNGEEALQVVRWRQNNDGSGYATADIGRINTQQDFLTVVAKQTLQLSNWDKIPAMAEIFATWVDTDLKLANLIWIGEQALTMGNESITFYTLPGDGAGYYKGVSYYSVDPQATLDLINSAFNPYSYDLTLDDLDILIS